MTRSRAFIAAGSFPFQIRNGLFPLLAPFALPAGRPLAN